MVVWPSEWQTTFPDLDPWHVHLFKKDLIWGLGFHVTLTEPHHFTYNVQDARSKMTSSRLDSGVSTRVAHFRFVVFFHHYLCECFPQGLISHRLWLPWKRWQTDQQPLKQQHVFLLSQQDATGTQATGLTRMQASVCRGVCGWACVSREGECGKVICYFLHPYLLSTTSLCNPWKSITVYRHGIKLKAIQGLILL